MKHRLVLVAAITAIVIAAAYWLLPSAPGASQPAASRAASATPRGAEPSLPATPAAVARPQMVMTESGLRPQTVRKTPRQWKDPVTGAINREILDAVPDPAAAAAEELKYRKSRLRLTLADAAAPCWSGSDSKEEIELEYTLVVEHETLRADDVRVKTSSITNPTTERCIIDAVRDLRTLAAKIPDMREDGGIIMSLHDLYDRNQRDARDRAPPSTRRDPVELPPAQPPN